MMENKFLKQAAAAALFAAGDRVLIAFSGGADSAALVYLLTRLQQQLGVTLCACHVHHGIRGEEADRDAAFSAQFCQRLGIPFLLRRVDVPAYARRTGKGMEESARMLRYQALEQAAAVCGATLIATAHTRSDQVETMLFHLIRGSGLAGMCGIAVRRGRIIRPLLWCTRGEIEAYCHAQHIPYVEDSTNADLGYSRNRIRHRIIPEMERINPAFLTSAARFMEQAGLDQAYLDQTAGEKEREARLGLHADAGYQAAQLRRLPPALRRRVLMKIIQTYFGAQMDSGLIDRCERLIMSGRSSCRAELKGGLEACLVYERFFIREKWQSPPLTSPVYGPITLEWGENELWQGKKVRLQRINQQEYQKIHRKFIKNVLSYDKIKGILSARSRIAGDRVELCARPGTKKLKKLFIDEKIPVTDRDELVLLCDEQGIVWVEGFGATRSAAAQASGELIWIEVEGEKEHASGCREDITQ